MICNYCGSIVKDGAKYCPHCGHSIDVSAQRVEGVDLTGVDDIVTGNEELPVETVDLSGRNRRSIIMISAIIAVIIVLAIGSVFAIKLLGTQNKPEIIKSIKSDEKLVKEIRDRGLEALENDGRIKDYFDEKINNKRFLLCRICRLYIVNPESKNDCEIIAVFWNKFQKREKIYSSFFRRKVNTWKKEYDLTYIPVRFRMSDSNDVLDISSDDIEIAEGKDGEFGYTKIDKLEDYLKDNYSGEIYVADINTL